MGTEERILAALRDLPPGRQTEVLDFVEFLRERRAHSTEPAISEPAGAFPATAFEEPEASSVYHGSPLTLAQMRDAIEWEAGEGK